MGGEAHHEIIEPEAPTATARIAILDEPAPAKALVKASAEPTDAGEAQDRVRESASPSLSDIAIPAFLLRGDPACIVSEPSK